MGLGLGSYFSGGSSKQKRSGPEGRKHWFWNRRYRVPMAFPLGALSVGAQGSGKCLDSLLRAHFTLAFSESPSALFSERPESAGFVS